MDQEKDAGMWGEGCRAACFLTADRRRVVPVEGECFLTLLAEVITLLAFTFSLGK